MNVRKLALALTISASFGFMVACGDDSSSTAPSTEDPISSAADVTSSESEGSSSSSAKAAVSSSAEATVTSSSESATTSSESKGGESSSSASLPNSSASLPNFENLTECTKVGEQLDVLYQGKEITVVCDEELDWVLDLDDIDGAEYCEPNGTVKTINIFDKPVSVTCTENAWVVDSVAMENALACETVDEIAALDIAGIAESLGSVTALSSLAAFAALASLPEAEEFNFICTETDDGNVWFPNIDFSQYLSSSGSDSEE